jgi:predicted Zn-dependent protease
MTYRTRRLPVAILVPALALAPACSRVENPATGRSEYTTLSAEQERELGAQEHPRILQQFGGAYSDEELQAYVQAVGNRVAANSDQPDAEFTFTLLDSEVPNAFALPGSYVYITRGLLALAETEAEMAGVLGHEIGHVTARHTAQRQTQATGAGVLATLATIAAAVLGGEVAGQLAQQATGVGAQAYLASYSRDQEFQADDLGVGYMTAAGYDPEAMATFLEKLAAESALDREIAGGDGDPAESWFATHPRTLDRVQRTADEAKASTNGGGRAGREEYLARIDGLIYGEDPRQGLVRGRQFVHPDLGFAFEAPPGFGLQNTPQAVLARDRAGRLMIFTGADLDGRGPESYVAGPGLQQVGRALDVEVSRPRNVQTFRVDGLPGASASATVRQGGRQADLGLAVIETGNAAYRFIFLSAGQMSRDEARAYQATINSFRELDPGEAARFRPRRIVVVEVEAGEDAADLASRMATDEAKRRRFEIINALALRQGISPGDEVKLILSEN